MKLSVTFSILKRIVMGETLHKAALLSRRPAFSILKRIVMGETCTTAAQVPLDPLFQYPQADRDG